MVSIKLFVKYGNTIFLQVIHVLLSNYKRITFTVFQCIMINSKLFIKYIGSSNRRFNICIFEKGLWSRL